MIYSSSGFMFVFGLTYEKHVTLAASLNSDHVEPSS